MNRKDKIRITQSVYSYSSSELAPSLLTSASDPVDEMEVLLGSPLILISMTNVSSSTARYMKPTATVIQVNNRNVCLKPLCATCIPENIAPDPEPTPQ